MEQFLPIELVEKIYRIKHQMEMESLKGNLILVLKTLVKGCLYQ